MLNETITVKDSELVHGFLPVMRRTAPVGVWWPPGDAPLARADHPSSTHAGPVLIGDAITSAATSAAMRAGLKDCKKADIFDMRVTEAAHDVTSAGTTFKGVWNEVWTFRMCSQMVDVAMIFIPDANGGGTSFTSGPVTPQAAAVKP